MHVPHLASSDVGRAAVLIPLRSLEEGKGRLATALNPDQRKLLIEEMALKVVRAAHDLDVLIVYDDPKVETWAKSHGALTLRPAQSGLNQAVSEGRHSLREAGYARVIVAHADLPYADDLRVMCTPDKISVAPDRHRDGTNVIAIPAELDFTFAYGPGSFVRHVEQARKLGIEPRIVDVPGLAWDVDHPDDLQDLSIGGPTPDEPSDEEPSEGNR